MAELGLIEIQMPKNCLLLLTPEEFRRGIARGKAKRRRQALEKRLAAQRPDPLRVPHPYVLKEDS